MDPEKRQLRDEYKSLTGKVANGFWTVEILKAEIAKLKPREEFLAPDSAIAEESAEAQSEYNTQKYLELPPPVIEHLKQTFGSWLNYFEIGQEYKQDFGGYGMYIKVPKEFSTEWKSEMRVVYDNVTRSVKRDDEGKDVMVTVITPDVRWKSLKDIADTNKWISLVKEHIIKNAYNKGIQLPNTNAPLDETRKTLDDYKASLHK